MRTPDRLINVAKELFFDYGFNAVGLNQILVRTGIAKTTFYKYFDSLEHLTVTCIEQDADSWFARVSSAIDNVDPSDGRARFDRFLEVFNEWVAADGSRGCPFLSAITEFPDERDPRFQAGAKAMRGVIAQVATLARGAGFDDPNAFAHRFHTIMAGTYVLQNTLGENHANDLVDQLVESATQNRSNTSNTKDARRDGRGPNPRKS